MGASVRTGEGARVKGLRWGSLRGSDVWGRGGGRGSQWRSVNSAARQGHPPSQFRGTTRTRTTSSKPRPMHHVLHTTSHVPRPTRHVVMSTSTIFLCNVCRSVSLVPGQPHARAQYTHTHASIHPCACMRMNTYRIQPITANRASSRFDDAHEAIRSVLVVTATRMLAHASSHILSVAVGCT